MHGTEDDIVPLGNGLAIHEACKNPVEPLWLEGYGHNDLPNAPRSFGEQKGPKSWCFLWSQRGQVWRWIRRLRCILLFDHLRKDADLNIWVGGDCKR